MVNKNRSKDNTFADEDKEFYYELLEYCKYVYEEEKERRDILNKTVRIYLSALGLALGLLIFKLSNIETISTFAQKISGLGQQTQQIFIILLVIAILLFLLSFIFTLLVVKIWDRERLCDPEHFITKASSMATVKELLSSIISDYTVSANRNHHVNERKARLLYISLILFLISLLFFISAYILSLV